MADPPKEYDHGLNSPEVSQPHAGLELNRQESNLEVYAVHNPHRTQGEWAYYSPTASYEKGTQPKEILGMQRRTFWFLIVLALVVVAAAVGGGVGGSIAVQNAKSKADASSHVSLPVSTQGSTTLPPSPTTMPSGSPTTPTTATYTPPIAAAVSHIAIACPPAPTLLGTWDSSASFRCTNFTDIRDGDIMGLVAYSLQSCIDACATMNHVWGRTLCIAVSVGAELSQQYTLNSGANCWLKGNGTRSVNSYVFTGARLCATPECEKVVERAA